LSRKILLDLKPQQIAEPDRKNYAVLRKCSCWLASLVAGRLAQDDVLQQTKIEILSFYESINVEF
jgi:hypothetical protein